MSRFKDRLRKMSADRSDEEVSKTTALLRTATSGLEQALQRLVKHSTEQAIAACPNCAELREGLFVMFESLKFLGEIRPVERPHIAPGTDDFAETLAAQIELDCLVREIAGLLLDWRAIPRDERAAPDVVAVQRLGAVLLRILAVVGPTEQIEAPATKEASTA